MEIRDWVMIVSASLVVLGWFATAIFNRRNEIAKKRMDYRLDMLHSFYPILFFIQKHPSGGGDKKEFLSVVENARPKFLLYGYDDEIELFEKFVAHLTNGNREGKVTLGSAQLNPLSHLLRSRIREELRLPDLKFQ